MTKNAKDIEVNSPEEVKQVIEVTMADAMLVNDFIMSILTADNQGLLDEGKALTGLVARIQKAFNQVK